MLRMYLQMMLELPLNTLIYMKSSQQKDIIQLEGAIVFGVVFGQTW